MPSVVIVEDESDVAALEIALASVNGFSVRTFLDGRRALDFFNDGGEPVAALVTDVHLPHLDGIELITALRAQPCYAQLPIIVVSGSTDPDVRERVLGSGANAYFSKPYSPAEIRQAIVRLIYV